MAMSGAEETAASRVRIQNACVMAICCFYSTVTLLARLRG